MKKMLFLGAALAGALHAPAYASFDSDGCDFWTSDCELSAWPFLAVSNDTRANMAMLEYQRHQFGSPFPAPVADQRSSRAQPFTISRIMPDGGSDERGSVTFPFDIDVLQRQATQLGLELDAASVRANPDGENGGPAVSNNPVTLMRFFQVLLDDAALSAEQRTALAQARLDQLPNSAESHPPEQRFPADSHAADLQNYLIAAGLFYEGDFAAAAQKFGELVNAKQPWVAETSAYMLIRTALNQSVQNAQDKYGFLDITQSDRDLVAQAIAQTDNYLKQYPQGQYAASAAGLYRRLYWFAGDWSGLAARAEQAMAQAGDVQQLQALINEADVRLLSEGRYEQGQQYFSYLSSADTPVLTLTQTLRRMRAGYNENYPDPAAGAPAADARPAAVSEDEITGYRPLFEKAGMMPAWDYLHLAWLFHQKRDYAAVVAAVAPATAETPLTNSATFSQQVLKGLALRAMNQPQEEEQHWRHLLGLKTGYTQQQFLQMMLGNILAAQGKTAAAFKPDSPVTNLRFRALLLKTAADQHLLRQQAAEGASNAERTIALHTLLLERLTAGDYQAYLQDKALKKGLAPLPLRKAGEDDEAQGDYFNDVDLALFDWKGENTEKGYYCAPLDETARALVKNAQDGHALNCVGEFFRLTQAHTDTWPEGGMQWRRSGPSPVYLGQYRLTLYQQVMQSPNAEPEDVSYALYRAIMCFAPSGSNDCDGQEIDKAQRKAWYQRLKTEFKASPWAQRLRYYW